MNVVRHILLLILAYILQTTWVHSIELAGIKPDLVVLLLVFIALTAGSLEATVLGFAIGFIQDTQTPANMGQNAFDNSVIAFCVGWLRLHVTADDPKVQIVVLLGAVLVHDLIYYIFDTGVAWIDIPFFWARYSVGGAIYTSALGGLVSAALVLRKHVVPA